MNIPSQVAPVLLDLPAFWREDVQLQLTSEENVLAWLEVDLDERLYFAKGLLVLTPSRLLWCPPGKAQTWQSQACQPDWRLLLSDHAGVGHLRLMDAELQLADWRFTLGHNLKAAALQDRFNKQQAGQSAGHTQTWCPQCHALLSTADETCRSCEEAQEEAPASTWSLFRYGVLPSHTKGSCCWALA